jgi:hypothetical protein
MSVVEVRWHLRGAQAWLQRELDRTGAVSGSTPQAGKTGCTARGFFSGPPPKFFRGFRVMR